MIRGGSTLGMGRIDSGDAGRIDSGADRPVTFDSRRAVKLKSVNNYSFTCGFNKIICDSFPMKNESLLWRDIRSKLNVKNLKN